MSGSTPLTASVADGARRCLKVGALGSFVTALCCFTPFLVLLLGFAGFSALVANLDYLVLPMLGLFLIVLFLGRWRPRRPR